MFRVSKSAVEDIFARLQLTTKAPMLGGFGGARHGWLASGDTVEVKTPITNEGIARVRMVTAAEHESITTAAHDAFLKWRRTPAPVRGQVVRSMGDELRKHKAALGALVTLEVGKIVAEGEGEVQEMIDICDFALGLSRQLHGLTIASERADHHMREAWHPTGLVGIISAFNFPVAVWQWNAAIAAVCGNATVWKPSDATPLTALACVGLAERVCAAHDVDASIFSLSYGTGAVVGEAIANDARYPVVSATGSTRMGRRVGACVGARLGRAILELGGNNAIVVTPSARLELAKRAIVFGAVGTAGQRCTSTRRVIVHRSVYEPLVASLVAAYKHVPIGDPRDAATLMGPLHRAEAVRSMQAAMAAAEAQGGRVLCGGATRDDLPGGLYVTPAIAEATADMAIVRDETFAPLLYVMPYGTEAARGDAAVAELEQALAAHNDVPQGLSGAIFTENQREAELFLSHRGADTGIANVNIGTSGAEIGGAFGGEKETGGGRESGSDAWKAYCRRQTQTINYSIDLPLAQGIKFDV